MRDLSLSRRRFLAGGLALGATAAAGCLGLDAAAGNQSSEEALRLALSREDGPLRESFVVDLAETRPDWDEDAFEAALAGRNYTTQYHTPFLSNPDDPKYAERDGTYYRLGSVVVGEKTVTYPVFRLFAVESGTDVPDSATVSTDSLSEADRRAVRIAHMAARARGNVGGIPSGLVQRGGYVFRRESAIESSALLADDGPDYVTYRETTYEIEATRETFHESVYRATVEPVADSPERLEAILRAQFVDARFDRADLSADAREVIRAARTGGHRETHPYSEGYVEALRALHRRPFIDGNVRKDAGVRQDGRRMVRYDGVYYDYRLRFVPAEES